MDQKIIDLYDEYTHARSSFSTPRSSPEVQAAAVRLRVAGRGFGRRADGERAGKYVAVVGNVQAGQRLNSRSALRNAIFSATPRGNCASQAR